jgi:glycosyltransferase involved in cell wall biosynthesis
VPNYNHAAYLEERLRSIFRQTYPPQEVLFLDDASSDESVEVARRLAAESPVPFRLVVNETNSGSTFRQWLKGIDLAAGDLVWIAESDDTCRPELLERLVPEFLDPEVNLAYCQSAIIGPDGRQVAADYLSGTEDLAPARWRYPYCVPGREEVELALSQRNTIPNASAVVFRKPANLDDYADLEQLRLGGDWLFYATRIRRGKIAYVPDSLNGHRHHDRTVRNAFERAVELFEEQLAVKARIFELFPVSAGAISCSMARSFVEYIDRTRDLGPRPAMTENPRLASRLGRIRSAFRDREWAPRDVRVLLVVSGVGSGPGSAEMIGLANELVGRFQVFLCNALPGVLDPIAAARIDERIVLLEGTPGILPWTWDGDPRVDPTASEAMSGRRAEVVRELIAFHQIDVIHSRGWWADRLVLGAIARPHTPWFIDLRDGEAYLADSRGDPEWPRLADEIGSSVRGVFCRRADDLRAFPVPPSPARLTGHSRLARGRRGRLARIFPLARTCPVPSGGAGDTAACDRAASAIAEAYRSAVLASRTPGPGPHFSGSAGCLRLQGVPRNAPTRSGGAV